LKTRDDIGSLLVLARLQRANLFSKRIPDVSRLATFSTRLRRNSSEAGFAAYAAAQHDCETKYQDPFR